MFGAFNKTVATQLSKIWILTPKSTDSLLSVLDISWKPARPVPLIRTSWTPFLGSRDTCYYALP